MVTITDNSPSQSSEISPSARATSRLRVSALWWLLALGLLVLGLGIRLFDLTDQPLDFHPTRQLRGAIIARGMYYQLLPNADPEIRQEAISFWKSTGQYEPSILEALVARTYLLMGGENIWVGRLYNSVFWLIGGLALFALARRMMANIYPSAPTGAIFGAALVSLAYYLILPFGVSASRAFQPDPSMVMWLVLSLYTLYRWSEKPQWKWAILTGLFAGIAVLTKVVAAYIIAGAAVAMVLYTLGLKRSILNLQVWAMAILMISPTAIYYLGREGRASEYVSSWTIALSHLLVEPSFYVRWLNLVQDLMGLTALLLALIGVLLSQPRNRALLLGLWIGYVLYGLFVPYQMYTHSYYHEQLIPIIALSLAPVAELIFERLLLQPRFWRFLFAGIALVAIFFPLWNSYTTMKSEDDRQEPAYWQQIASYLPTDGKILALTQDYGYRLMYYGWRKVILWPTRGEINLSSLRGSNKNFEDYFAKRIDGKNYFLITAFGQFNDQPDLKKVLSDQYPVVAEGDGYLIYDLAHPTSAP